MKAGCSEHACQHARHAGYGGAGSGGRGISGPWISDHTDIKIGSMMRKYSQLVGVQSQPVGLVRVLNFSILTRHGHHVLVLQLDGCTQSGRNQTSPAGFQFDDKPSAQLLVYLAALALLDPCN